MAGSKTLIVIGGGLAGAKAAESARTSGFDGRIVLIGEEAHPPYERPPLSKAVLRGEAEPASAAVQDPSFYAENGIEVRTGERVSSLDPGRRAVHLEGGEAMPFDSAVLATGAEPRALAVPGADLDGVHYLRTLDDAAALAAAIRNAGRVAIIGAGWIGSEVAASARQMGASVVLIDSLDVPLQRVLGPQVGAVFHQLHADHGVELRMGHGITELSGPGRVTKVHLANGSTEAADLVVVGIGVRPRVELAVAAGLAVDNGVLVDQFLATSAPGIYAAGDIANAAHPVLGRRLRVEHWANALNQGLTAGANAAGARQVYDRLPYFFSDQFDLGMEYIGHGDPDDSVVIRGDLERREFLAFWLREGRITAAMNVNIWDLTDDLKALVAAGHTVDPQRLADPDIPLGDVLAEAQPSPAVPMPGS